MESRGNGPSPYHMRRLRAPVSKPSMNAPAATCQIGRRRRYLSIRGPIRSHICCISSSLGVVLNASSESNTSKIGSVRRVISHLLDHTSRPVNARVTRRIRCVSRCCSLGVASCRIVKNNPGSVAVAGPQIANSMLQVHSVHTSRAMNRSMTGRNYCGASLAQRQHERSRLHAGALLGHHEFAALEVAARLGEQQYNLQWKNMLPIEILVQTVVVASAVLQQKRRWLPLSGRVAAVDEIDMPVRETCGHAHRVIPAVGHRRQPH